MHAFVICVCALLCGLSVSNKVLIVSVDGLRASYLSEKDTFGLSIPTIRSLISEGLWLRNGVDGILPTVTYPLHTTIMTGCYPTVHAILNNVKFDPEHTAYQSFEVDGKMVDYQEWNWYSRDIMADTLWDAAKRSNFTTASVSWPVTVGNAHVDFNVPEIWPKSRLISVSNGPSPNIAELASEPGNLIPDSMRTDIMLDFLENGAEFATLHLAALDSMQHQHGYASPEAFAALEATDVQLGRLVAALADDTVIALVSDHGFLNVSKEIYLEVSLKTLRVPSADTSLPWTSYAWGADGVAGIYVHNDASAEFRSSVRALFDDLLKDPATGLSALIDAEDLQKMHGFPGAAFAVVAADGFFFGDKGPTGTLPDTMVVPSNTRGMHGYPYTDSRMRPSFVIKAPTVRKGVEVDSTAMHLIDVGPTIAKAAGVELLPPVNGKALDVFATTSSSTEGDVLSEASRTVMLAVSLGFAAFLVIVVLAMFRLLK